MASPLKASILHIRRGYTRRLQYCTLLLTDRTKIVYCIILPVLPYSISTALCSSINANSTYFIVVAVDRFSLGLQYVTPDPSSGFRSCRPCPLNMSYAFRVLMALASVIYSIIESS